MAGMVAARIKLYLTKTVWEKEPTACAGVHRYWLTVLQFLLIVLRNAWRNQSFLRASALAFTTLLALVPLLAILFALLKGLGVQNQVAPFLLAQLSAGSQEVAARIINYIDNTNMASLGWIGFAGLIFTVIMLLDSVEEAFNEIWLVKETRTLSIKLGGYLVLIICTPLLIFIALSMTTFLEGQSAFYWLLKTVHIGDSLPDFLYIIPHLVVWAALTFLYMVVPNTKVHFGAALRGAFLAATLWQLAQWFYVHFQLGVAKNNIIYGTMAALPTFMLWIYVSWLILLFGVEIVHAQQNITSLKREIRLGSLSQKLRELLSLAILHDMARVFADTSKGWSGEHFGETFDLPERLVKELLNNLLEEGFIYGTADDPPLYHLTQAPEEIMVSTVLAALRDTSSSWRPLSLTKDEAELTELLARVEYSGTEILTGISIRNIVPD
jgi:membrane protein